MRPKTLVFFIGTICVGILFAGALQAPAVDVLAAADPTTYSASLHHLVPRGWIAGPACCKDCPTPQGCCCPPRWATPVVSRVTRTKTVVWTVSRTVRRTKTVLRKRRDEASAGPLYGRSDLSAGHVNFFKTPGLVLGLAPETGSSTAENQDLDAESHDVVAVEAEHEEPVTDDHDAFDSALLNPPRLKKRNLCPVCPRKPSRTGGTGKPCCFRRTLTSRIWVTKRRRVTRTKRTTVTRTLSPMTMTTQTFQVPPPVGFCFSGLHSVKP
jgi:hypothetical protein